MTINVAIAGAGHIAAVHARAIKSQGGKIVAVVETFADKAAAFAQQFGIPHQYSSIEDAIASAKLDALVIGTPNFLHAPQAIAALKAGIPVLVEKPMAINAVEAEQMLDLSLQLGVVLMVAHCWRFDEEVLWLKQQVNQLGKLVRTKSYGIHTHWGPQGWFTQKALAGGGAIADIGIHALDTARFLLGDPKPVSVFAKVGTYYRNHDVDDTGMIFVNWDSGASSYIESGWCQPHADAPQSGTQIYGTDGFGQVYPTRLILSNQTPPNHITKLFPLRLLPMFKHKTILEVKSGFKFPRKDHYPQSMYDRQMAHFFECIQTNRIPIPGGLEGLINMRVINAVYKSAETGEVVDIS